LGWLFPLSDIQLDFDSFVSFVVLRLARSILPLLLLLTTSITITGAAMQQAMVIWYLITDYLVLIYKMFFN